MILRIELKKLKRTGYFLTALGGGLLAAAFPVVNMLARADAFTFLPGNPFTIMLDSNWQMIAMLNILIAICGACLMYHTEYADHGAQKMDMLPIRTGSMFLAKFIIAAFSMTVMIAIETAALTLCAVHWFSDYTPNVPEILKSAGFMLYITLPTLMLMLVIASACKNMWVSLGIGVILVFTLSILTGDNVILNLLPFSSPYQTLHTVSEQGRELLFLSVCGAETGVFALTELICQKVRRCSE